MNTLTTRRRFLRTSVLGGALSWTVPGFLSRTFDQLHAQSVDALTQTATGRDGPILVVMQLAGGNDGLNTLVPYQNDDYYRARPTLGIPAKDCLRLNDEIGLPQYLEGFKALYDEGHLAMIQGVGYPNPNRSHFRSTEIWHAATDADQTTQHGWIGRYFDNACQGADARVGLAVARQAPQAFANGNSLGISLQNPASLSVDGDPAMMEGMSEGGTVTDYAGMPQQAGAALDFLERVSLDAQVSTEQIGRLMREGKNAANYPNDPLARDLSFVARMIAGNMPTRVYYVSQGGYDTHRSQRLPHQRLLGQLGGAMQAFLNDLKAQGNLDRVLVLTFSEFGRRVAENASGGTDHGAAAPVFLFGGNMKPGLIGQTPSLNPRDLDKGDLRHAIDFRSVYATVLEHWMRLDPQLTPRILGRRFPALPLA